MTDSIRRFRFAGRAKRQHLQLSKRPDLLVCRGIRECPPYQHVANCFVSQPCNQQMSRETRKQLGGCWNKLCPCGFRLSGIHGSFNQTLNSREEPADGGEVCCTWGSSRLPFLRKSRGETLTSIFSCSSLREEVSPLTEAYLSILSSAYFDHLEGAKRRFFWQPLPQAECFFVVR